MQGFASEKKYTGQIIQVVNYQTGAVATGSTAIPLDDSIPQNTEGTEFMTLAITPKSTSNKLKIDVVFYGADAGLGIMTVALFQDSTANAEAVGSILAEGTSAQLNPIVFSHYMTAGTASSTTFKVRAGSNSGSTITFNGKAGGRLFGGVTSSSITITEIAA